MSPNSFGMKMSEEGDNKIFTLLFISINLCLSRLENAVTSRRIKGLQAFVLHFPGSGCMQMGPTRHKSPLIQFPFSWLHSLSLSPC